jgi:hypothetical protein
MAVKKTRRTAGGEWETKVGSDLDAPEQAGAEPTDWGPFAEVKGYGAFARGLRYGVGGRRWPLMLVCASPAILLVVGGLLQHLFG